jgi:hypothetical protein
VYSASGADKKEQGQGEEAEEGACCIKCIPVDTLRPLIRRFDKAVIIIRWGSTLYQCIVPMHMNTHTHARPCLSLCCHAENMMFDFVISMFVLPCIPIVPLFQAQIRKISGSIFAGCDSGGMFWGHFAACDNHSWGSWRPVHCEDAKAVWKRSAGEHISERHIQTRRQLGGHLTFYVIIQCSSEMAVRSMAGECV